MAFAFNALAYEQVCMWVTASDVAVTVAVAVAAGSRDDGGI